MANEITTQATIDNSNVSQAELVAQPSLEDVNMAFAEASIPVAQLPPVNVAGQQKPKAPVAPQAMNETIAAQGRQAISYRPVVNPVTKKVFQLPVYSQEQLETRKVERLAELAAIEAAPAGASSQNSMLFDNTWPETAITTTKKGKSGYPKSLAKVASAPEFMYALGEMALLKDPLVAMTFTRFTKASDSAVKGMSQTRRYPEYQQQLAVWTEAVRVSALVAEHLTAVEKQTIVVCSLVNSDSIIMDAAFAVGGRVVAIIPCSIDNRDILESLQKYREYIERGQLLVISFTSVEEKWNTAIAQQRLEAMATLIKSGLITECTSVARGVGDFARILRKLGVPVYYRNDRHFPLQQAHVELAKLGCIKLTGKTFEETFAPVVASK